MARNGPHAERPSIVVLCGPTASGKTGMACRLAESYDLEIISADSRQVYRKMDIGTAKPTAAERAAVRHHLVDIVDPDEEFSVAAFTEQANRAIADITARHQLPLVVGGTGLYIRALTDGLADIPSGDQGLRDRLHAIELAEGEGALHRRLSEVDPIQAERIHPHNLVRIVRALEVYEQSGVAMSEYQQRHGFSETPYRVLKLYLNRPRNELNDRINRRVDQMMNDGFLDEVSHLLSCGYDPGLKSMQAIGYHELTATLRGEMNLDEAVELIKRETRRYAKRQETWFKKEKSIISVDSFEEIDRIQPLIDSFLLQKGKGHGQNTI